MSTRRARGLNASQPRGTKRVSSARPHDSYVWSRAGKPFPVRRGDVERLEKAALPSGRPAGWHGTLGRHRCKVGRVFGRKEDDELAPTDLREPRVRAIVVVEPRYRARWAHEHALQPLGLWPADCCVDDARRDDGTKHAIARATRQLVEIDARITAGSYVAMHFHAWRNASLSAGSGCSASPARSKAAASTWTMSSVDPSSGRA